MKYDAVIIGAGITGTMLARKLSFTDWKIAVLDKENDVADGATMANSAIVHTGYDPEPNTLKAELNVKGARQYEDICHELGCAYKVVGAYIAACGKEEETHLDVLAQRAKDRGIPFQWLSGDEARKEEKNLNDDVTKVLSYPTTAVIYPWEVATACMENAIANGAELYLNEEVQEIKKEGNVFVLKTQDQIFEADFVINCAGVHAEEIAKMVNPDPGFHMTPRKGEYYVLDQDTHYVNHIIFPVPSKEKGKGVLAVPTVYGNTLIGPNSDYVEDEEDKGTSTDGLDYVQKNINKTMKNVPLRKSIRTFAGLRPSSTCKDFIIQEDEKNPHFINAASIESPGLASAPAIADRMIEILQKDADMHIRRDAVRTRKPPIVMSRLTREERNLAIQKNPLYGKIICRCEQVSEGEIVDAIHAPIPATTVKAIKKRVRPGMGRCQGGFCEPRVVEILARELNVSPLDIVLDSKKSHILEEENR